MRPMTNGLGNVIINGHVSSFITGQLFLSVAQVLYYKYVCVPQYLIIPLYLPRLV